MTVDVLGPMDRGHWHQLWAAAVAVNSMCVRYGLPGYATGLG